MIYIFIFDLYDMICSTTANWIIESLEMWRMSGYQCTRLNTVSITLSVFVLISFMYYLCMCRNESSVKPRWPPGPKPWPVIGNILELKPRPDKRLMDNLQDLVDKFGPMVHVNIGMGVDIVIISGTELIHEAYVTKSDSFSDRPLYAPTLKDRGGKGIIFRNGTSWRRMHRFTIRTLKDLGMCKDTMSSAIQQEAHELVRIFSETKGEPFDCKNTFYIGVSNIISYLVFSQRFEHNDPRYHQVLEAMDDYFSNGGSSNYAKSFLPRWLMKFFSSQIRKCDQGERIVMAFIQEMVDKHRLNFDMNQMRDFTDYFIKSQVTNDANLISETDLFQLIGDLFLAGTETVSTTLLWWMLYMVIHPDVQNKCRAEIHEVIGTSRSPRANDKGKLPYTESVILETQRLANIVPVGLPHSTSKPVEIGGYLLPENTMIMANVSESMTGGMYWNRANEFLPERWLKHGDAKDGLFEMKFKDPPKSFMPFGIGPRKCIGNNIANMEMFIFVTTLLQQLSFSVANPDQPPPSTRGVHLTALVPKPFKVRVSSSM